MAYEYINPKYLQSNDNENETKAITSGDLPDYLKPRKKYITQEEAGPSGIDWSKTPVYSAQEAPKATVNSIQAVRESDAKLTPFTPKKPSILDTALRKWENIPSQEYKQANQATPDWLKPVGYAIESPLRIPFVNRLVGAAAKTAAGEDSIAANAPINTYNSNSGKVGNLLADIAGSGLGMTVAPQYQQLGQAGNIGENLLNQGLNKFGVNTGSKLAQYGLTGLRGAGEMGTLGGIEANLQGANGQDTFKAIRDNAAMGVAFGVGSKAVGDLSKGAIGLIKNKGVTDYKVMENGKLITPTPSTINEIPSSNTLATPTEKVAQNGVKLNTDNPTNDTLNPSIGATDRTQSMSQLKSSKMEDKTSLGQKFDDFYTHMVDINNPIKKIDDPTYTLATNSKKVGGTVSHIVNNELVDMKGEKIGESLGSIAKDIPKGQENDFMYYLLHKHNIDRVNEGKPVFTDFTSEESAKAAKLLEQRNPEFKKVGDRLNKFLNTFESEWANKSGLMSDDLWQQLQDKYKNYIPTQRSFNEVEQGVASTQGRGFVDQKTPINKATGSDRDIVNPLENIMRLVDRTVRTARYNEVGQSFADALRSNPKLSKYAEILPADAEINPNVNNVVSVLENGKPVNIQVNDKRLLEALKGLYKSQDLNKAESAAKAFNNVFKSLITTKNPVFAVRNIMRDLPTGYINGSEANPVKYLVDWVKASKDLLTDSEVAQQYRGLGGESSNFLNTEKLYKNADDILGRKLVTDSDGFITGSKNKNPLAKGLNFIGEKVEKLNNVTESSTRLAEFKRILEKTGDPQKALYEAGEVTTNFSRGGDLTKWIDIFVPYANAGVQGLDKLARQLDPRNPKQLLQTLVKGGIGVGIPTIAFHAMNMNNPYYNELDNRTKDNYFLIPNKLGTKDEKGIPTTFIKIPKSREYGVLFSTLFERLQRATNKDPESFKGFGSTVATNFSPANPLEDNIASPLINLKTNKDFAGRAIVPQAMLSDERSNYLQYDEKTSELTKWIAKELNKVKVDLPLVGKHNVDVSPKQMDYLIKSYTGVIGQLGLPLTVKGGTNTADKAFKPLTTQFVSDPLYSNQISIDFYDNLQKAKKAASDNNLLNKIDSKVVTPQEELRNKLNKIQTEITATNKEMLKSDTANDAKKIKELRQKILDLMKSGNDMYYKSK